MNRMIFVLLISLMYSGLNIAIAQELPPRPDKYFVPFSAPQNFIEHASNFEEEAIQVGSYDIWSTNTPAGGMGNVIVIEGEDSLVIIDTTVAVEFAERAREIMRGITDKPIEAVIYTHHHADHTKGATALISREDAESGRVKVIAAENFMQETERENAASGPIMALRAGYMYGVLLPDDAEGKHYHIGCCGFELAGTGGFIAPKTTVPIDRESTHQWLGIDFRKWRSR